MPTGRPPLASSSSTSSTSSISVLPDYITSSHSRPGSPSRHSRHGTPTSAAEKGKSPVARGEGIVRLKLSSALESYPPHLMAAVTGLQNVSKPSVQLVLPERVVGIVPPTVTFGQGQSDDAGALEGGRGARLSGFFVWSSPTAKHVKAVRVSLFCRIRFLFPGIHGPDSGAWEETIINEREVSLGEDEGGYDLQSGVNVFEFAFHIPPDFPTSDRAEHGMIHWHVRGTVEGSGSRLFGKDLSEERLVRVTPWPTEEDDILQLAVHNEAVPSYFGPYSLDLFANQWLIGSALYVAISMPDPPPGLTIFAVDVTLWQTISMESQRVPGKTSVLEGRPFSIVHEGERGPNYGVRDFARLAREKGSVLFSSQEQGEAPRPGMEPLGWTFKRFGRIPDDDHVRPDTHPGTNTALRFRTNLRVDIIYSEDAVRSDQGEELIQVATLFKNNVPLGHCRAVHEQFVLPTYDDNYQQGQEALETFKRGANKQGFIQLELATKCLCIEPWESLLEREMALIARSGTVGWSEAEQRQFRERRSGFGSRKIGETYDVGTGRSAEKWMGFAKK